MTFRWILCVLGGMFFVGSLAGCSKDGEAQNARVEKPALAVETVPVTARDLAEGIEVTGSLEPKFSADVKTQIPGLVKQVYVTEWVRVRKGTPLARIDTAEPEALAKRAEASVESARAALAQAQVSATRAERELARIIKLKESGLATQQSVDDARTESAAAQARIDAAQAQDPGGPGGAPPGAGSPGQGARGIPAGRSGGPAGRERGGPGRRRGNGQADLPHRGQQGAQPDRYHPVGRLGAGHGRPAPGVFRGCPAGENIHRHGDVHQSRALCRGPLAAGHRGGPQ